MNLRSWIFIIQSIIVVPPLILYILELKILLITRRNEFSSPFFTLFIACGITDIIGVILCQFFYALPMASDIGDAYISSLPVWSFTAANGLLFYLPIVEDFLNIAVALNRLCALSIPLIYDSIWSPRRTFLVIILCFLLGIIPNYIVFFSPAIYIKLPVGRDDPPVNLLYPLTLVTFPQISRTLIIGITTFSCNSISAVVNIMAIVKLMTSQTNNDAERKLLLLGIALLLTNLPTFAYQLFFFLNTSSPYAGYVVQSLPWIIIFKCLLHPILLFLTNSSIRKRIIGIRSKENALPETTVTIHNRPR